MAEINVERKGGGSILPWIIGLLALLLVGWLLYSMFDRDDNVAEAPVVTEPLATTPVIDPAAAADVDVGPVIPVAAIVTVPANYVNQTVSGTARVAQVVSDRGFWIDDGNQRVFTIIDEPKPEIKNIRAGQMVRLDGAQVMTAASQVPGQLEAETQQAIQAQPAFLYVRAANIFITQTAS
ncbi:hypothetical protein BH20GEM3_BH20GEM3_02940 [soil metagenome]